MCIRRADVQLRREPACNSQHPSRAVETHLRHAFQKLGVIARTQLRGALAEKITGAP